MEALAAAGLGLDYEKLRLERATNEWIEAGVGLGIRVNDLLKPVGAPVAVIGSSSVLGLFAKPIIDLAVGCSDARVLGAVTALLESAGWIYRGDGGDDGGHLFVLESRPGHRVAHLHVVPRDGSQWQNYLRFRDLLRADANARSTYEEAKLTLWRQLGNDRRAYTEAKGETVAKLLADLA